MLSLIIETPNHLGTIVSLCLCSLFWCFVAGTQKIISAPTLELNCLEFLQMRTIRSKQEMDAGGVLQTIAFKILLGFEWQFPCGPYCTLAESCNPIFAKKRAFCSNFKTSCLIWNVSEWLGFNPQTSALLFLRSCSTYLYSRTCGTHIVPAIFLLNSFFGQKKCPLIKNQKSDSEFSLTSLTAIVSYLQPSFSRLH